MELVIEGVVGVIGTCRPAFGLSARAPINPIYPLVHRPIPIKPFVHISKRRGLGYLRLPQREAPLAPQPGGGRPLDPDGVACGTHSASDGGQHRHWACGGRAAGAQGIDFILDRRTALVAGIVVIGLTFSASILDRARRWCAPAATFKRRRRPLMPSTRTCPSLRSRACGRVCGLNGMAWSANRATFTNAVPPNTGDSTTSAASSNSKRSSRTKPPKTQTRPQQQLSSL